MGETGTLDELSRGLAGEVARLADRLRSMSDTRLAQPLPPHASRADAAHALAGRLAAAGQGVEQRTAAGPPSWRQVPRLHDFAVGDQVAVMGADLGLAVLGLDVEDPVWTPSGRRPLAEVLAAATAEVRALRLAL